MSSPGFVWISERDVASLIDVGEGIEALEKGLLAEARGEAQNMVKTHVGWGQGATLHAIGATFPREGFAGTKTWAHTEGGATPLLILFDSGTGALKAVIEAFALGQMRTGAASGVATRWMAAEGADELAIVGTGKQAITQVAAVLAVRPIRRIRVFGRNEERRLQFATRLREEFRLEVGTAGTVAEAVEGAPIITVVTRATEPILRGDMVACGAHINAVGAIVPERAELARSVLTRCSQIVVDSIPQAQKLSRELMDYVGSGEGSWEQIRSLADLAATLKVRSAGVDITLFKSLGTGISDLALGIEVYRRGLRLGVGQELTHPTKAAPRLRAPKQITPTGA